MATQFAIREMQPEDLPAVAGLYRAMYRDQKELGMVLDFNEAGLEDLLQVQLKSRFYISLVLADEQRVAGFAVGNLMKTGAKYVLNGQPMIGFIQDVYVEEALRKGGYGHRLVDALEEQFKEQGVQHIELHVLEGNVAAKGFWRGQGYHDVIRVMYKTLDGE